MITIQPLSKRNFTVGFTKVVNIYDKDSLQIQDFMQQRSYIPLSEAIQRVAADNPGSPQILDIERIEQPDPADGIEGI